MVHVEVLDRQANVTEQVLPLVQRPFPARTCAQHHQVQRGCKRGHSRFGQYHVVDQEHGLCGHCRLDRPQDLPRPLVVPVVEDPAAVVELCACGD